MKKKEQIAILEATLTRDPNNHAAREALNTLKNKKHKYSAKPQTIDGHRFDSKREADYYQELLIRKRAGDIKDFELQPEFILQDPLKREGKTIRAIKYRADFLIFHTDGRTEIIDVKGFETAEFKLKKKLFMARYPEMEITIV